MTHPLLYEINTRCWLRRLSERHGKAITLANVPDEEMEGLQKLGFTHVWAMGIWTSGPLSRAHALENVHLQSRLTRIFPAWSKHDVSGSPYAIGSYTVPATLGGDEGLKAFRRQLNTRGMKLLLDFVPNHVGLDHPWIAKRPELFVQSADESPGTFQQETRAGVRRFAHGKDPYFPPWSDTAQLDYRRPETRAAMKEVLQSVAGKCDGVRCDMAMLLLNEVFAKTWAHFPAAEPAPADEFWKDAIQSVRQNRPDFTFLAEVYWGLEPRLQELGFDFTYAKTIYDQLLEHKHAELQKELIAASPAYLAASTHFLENHDERRAVDIFFPAEHRAAALLMLGLPGMRLIYEGQLQGARIQVPVQLARWPDERVNAGIAAMYEQLLGVLKNSAIGHGEFRLLAPENLAGDSCVQNFIVIQWQKTPREFELVAVNLANQPGKCRVKAVIADMSSGNWGMCDLLGADSDVQQFHGGDLEGQGIHLELPAHGTQVLRFAQS